jgi:ribulose 1,5-bisphosphate carboxylase large subunit-like protein
MRNMNELNSELLGIFKFDLEKRDELIRKTVFDCLAQLSKPDLSRHIVATYFTWAHNLTPAQVGNEICYHMTSGVRKAEPGTLLDRCTGRVLDSVCFDKEERMGIVRVAFPLEMLQDSEGRIYSTDILHIAAGAGVFSLRENRDAILCDIAMSDEVLATFPGPAYGAPGIRKLTNLDDDVAFGTILKPCTGITPQEEAGIIYEAASNPLFVFIKEDENFLPHVPFAEVKTRAQHAIKAIERAKTGRDGRGLIFANHVTAPPHLIRDHIKAVLDLGINGLMFSEYYIGGAVRMVREMTRNMENPPVIYGHNGGIDSMTHCIWREVLDLFARLDGIDFRQTAPYTHGGMSLLRPYGLEWRNVESILTKPLGGHAPVMIARAGGLDQGNLIANFIDIKNNDCDLRNYLFLAGSAINGIKNDTGKYDPRVGAEAMQQTISIYNEGVFSTLEQATPQELKKIAKERGFNSLRRALEQRYKNRRS